jgi:predicted  nucleic acid-binding Zn ribbon protein
MFVATIRFRFPPGIDDSGHDLVQSLLAAWYKNGQIHREWFLCEEDQGAIAIVSTPELGAPEPGNANRWVKEAEDKLRALDIEGPHAERVVRNKNMPSACVCPSRPSFVLFTTYLARTSALQCGACFSPVPLYQLPPTSGDEFWDVVNWAVDFQACDTLQMGGPAEAWAEAELASPESGLSQFGREVAARVSEVTGLPTYYYLLQAQGVDLQSERSRLCPVCGSRWLLEKPWHGLFDFRCDICHLVSNIAYSFDGEAARLAT